MKCAGFVLAINSSDWCHTLCHTNDWRLPIRACFLWIFRGMAETEGFEPSIPLTGYDDLANRCLQPLGHVSGRQAR